MLVFAQPFIRDLTDRTISQFDITFAAFHCPAEIMQRDLLVAKLDDGLEVEPINARSDVNAQGGRGAVDPPGFEIPLAINFKTRLRELRDRIHQKVEGV